VQTFSICNVRWDMQPLDEPELPAVIAIDGSDGGLLHTLGEVEPDEVTIGMKVEAVWKRVGERTGSILDIAYFRPRRGDPGNSRSERGRASGGSRREDAS
jgi:uncharacterized OB-fold protein